MWYYIYVIWNLGFNSSYSFLHFLCNNHGAGVGAVCVLINYSEVTQPCGFSSLLCSDCFQDGTCAQALVLSTRDGLLYQSGHRFLLSLLRISSGSTVWEFAGLPGVSLDFPSAWVGWGDETACRARSLWEPWHWCGSGTVSLLSSPLCQPPGLFTCLLFSVSHTCHRPVTTPNQFRPLKGYCMWDFLERCESSLHGHRPIPVYPLCGFIYLHSGC